jgi:hypothetical protein
MSQMPNMSSDENDARAAELRELAGPVNPDLGRHGDDDDLPAETPDARTQPEIDEVRAEETDDVPDEVTDPYELRSMPVQPNPSEDDPGSYLNT